MVWRGPLVPTGRDVIAAPDCLGHMQQDLVKTLMPDVRRTETHSPPPLRVVSPLPSAYARLHSVCHQQRACLVHSCIILRAIAVLSRHAAHSYGARSRDHLANHRHWKGAACSAATCSRCRASSATHAIRRPGRQQQQHFPSAGSIAVVSPGGCAVGCCGVRAAAIRLPACKGRGCGRARAPGLQTEAGWQAGSGVHQGSIRDAAAAPGRWREGQGIAAWGLTHISSLRNVRPDDTPCGHIAGCPHVALGSLLARAPAPAACMSAP